MKKMGKMGMGSHKKTNFKGDIHSGKGMVGKAGSPSGGGGKGGMKKK